ncbi:histidine kinase [Natrinema thermotolerans]|uniref:Histidine kinase n=1 Tax=Natrinema thermotolerans TaxID=121872 RepID=A0AAF0P992_9EURY|nr:DICT sensory domain-containing protein [Natrinema thermotolerans]QCC59752.1 histidine kinase [Natrinema thermotolerans]WMT06741.1 histidine kinase [Natrinema thermotolerans]
MTLRSFIDDVGSPDRTIAIVADGSTGPLAEMLSDAFAGQPIAVERAEAGAIGSDPDPEIDDALATEGDTAVLLEDGQPVAASPMRTLYDAILAINSDLFVTGARGMGEIAFPDVLAGLEGTRLRLRGYPLAHKEKLLLIVVSRYIEQRAWAAGSGTLRSAFQQLSRIDDEIGTYETYAELAETDVDVHVYGVDDGCPPELDATVHTGTGPEYRDGWFVVFDPDDRRAPDAVGTALVCLETEPRVWDGFWTTDPDRVTRIADYIAREL